MNHQERERKERDRKLAELGLRPIYDGPRCFHCEIPLPSNCFDLLCAACDDSD
jgi:hypothetical protein